MKGKTITVLLLTTIVSSTLATGGARAGGPAVSPPIRVSGTNPLPPAGSATACGSDANHQDWEAETSLSVNPADPANLATAWIQDWADAIAVGYSTDGGGTWRTSLPPTSGCTGGIPQYSSAFDPWLSFGQPTVTAPHGTAYLISTACCSNRGLASVKFGSATGFGILLNRSTDGGATWSPPYVLDTADGLNNYLDGGMVIADPTRPGVAYAVWRKGTPTNSERKQYVSHTADGGITWSAPSAIPSTQLQLTGQLVVLGDGSLMNLYAQIPFPAPGSTGATGPTTIMATRSTDLGATWSTPTTVAVADSRTMTWVSATVGPDGTVYASWQRADTKSFSILLSRSTDGGTTWQAPTVVATEPGAAEFPGGESDGKILDAVGLAVAPDGTLGVLFYDHRRDPVGTNPPRLTDLWLRTSHDAGRGWKEFHVAGSFDQTTAPSLATDMDGNGLPGRVAGGFIGDYQSLVPFAGGFASAFTLARTRAANEQGADWFTDPTDIYFSRTT